MAQEGSCAMAQLLALFPKHLGGKSCIGPAWDLSQDNEQDASSRLHSDIMSAWLPLAF